MCCHHHVVVELLIEHDLLALIFIGDTPIDQTNATELDIGHAFEPMNKSVIETVNKTAAETINKLAPEPRIEIVSVILVENFEN